MDTFPTQSLASALVILSQIEAIDNGVYGEYNPTTLNPSQVAINETLAADYPTSLSYLWATFATYNTTAPLGIDVTADYDQSVNVGGGGAPGPKNTLAM